VDDLSQHATRPVQPVTYLPVWWAAVVCCEDEITADRLSTAAEVAILGRLSRGRMNDMPLISYFYGIRIYLYFADHPPRHVHAR